LKLDNVEQYLDILLKDFTTGKNIIWATNLNDDDEQMSIEEISKLTLLNNSNIINYRFETSPLQKKTRTKKHAEVATPIWMVNNMINLIDENYFGRENVFNYETEKSWKINNERIIFPAEKSWIDYVNNTRLEITCGEAPFLVTRYNSITGEPIPIKNRVGILDRKLRVVSENTNNLEDWSVYALQAYKATYGYEFQGDSLLIARVNLLNTFEDYYLQKSKEILRNNNQNVSVPTDLMEKVANIISMNVWQMDGLKDTIPLINPPIYCKIFDWQNNKSVIFAHLKNDIEPDSNVLLRGTKNVN